MYFLQFFYKQQQQRKKKKMFYFLCYDVPLIPFFLKGFGDIFLISFYAGPHTFVSELPDFFCSFEVFGEKKQKTFFDI